ncbi:MAG TPA: DEAD/DEAH box helicase [Blastocatellia bacterium]|nr:DEAD/DEAH box helicase [Blastocatellia bacterium]
MKKSHEAVEHAFEELEHTFEELGLPEPLLAGLRDVGYEVPTPIQTHTIPALLAGRDLIGQAQTGTGKTAAFALPILAGLDLELRETQALILAPTRELALQVAEAIHTYAKHLGTVRVLPVYGGQPIQKQVERLRMGAQIVVGTPGRVMDHLRRGTMRFESLKFVVLDEADEMLRMGFIEDVEWILNEAPGKFQTALFSATMPREVRRIADKHLDNPATVELEHATMTVPQIEQRYFNVSEQGKLDVLTRILEAEHSDAVLIFVRTKNDASELNERLQARGYASEALHGDLTQPQRETVLRRLRAHQVEIVVATDVAARGLDVDHITHVINFDVPHDVESYVHRIGRTGRAGREGKAILLVTPRQGRMLREIERYTGARIEPMKMPTRADIAARRTAMFKESIRSTIAEGDLELYLSLVEELVEEGLDATEIAAAASRLARGDKPLEMEIAPETVEMVETEEGMIRLFLDAGRRDGIRPGDIVGAIANEADVPGRAIGSIDIYDKVTFVEIPAQFARQVLDRMGRAMIRGRFVSIRTASPDAERPQRRGQKIADEAERRPVREKSFKPAKPKSGPKDGPKGAKKPKPFKKSR